MRIDPPTDLLYSNLVRGLVIIPAHNEEGNLKALCARLRFQKLTEDILVVDDGSQDGTAALAQKEGLKVHSHRHNLGYASAIRSGVRHAQDQGYDYVVTLDADGQHDPADIRRLVDALYQQGQAREDRADVVIGSRFVGTPRYDAPLLKRCAMIVCSLLTGLLGKARIRDTTSGFRALRASAYEGLLLPRPGDLHAEVLLLWMRTGLHIREVPITTQGRVHGLSMYGPRKVALYPLHLVWALLLLPEASKSDAS